MTGLLEFTKEPIGLTRGPVTTFREVQQASFYRAQEFFEISSRERLEHRIRGGLKLHVLSVLDRRQGQPEIDAIRSELKDFGPFLGGQALQAWTNDVDRYQAALEKLDALGEPRPDYMKGISADQQREKFEAEARLRYHVRTDIIERGGRFGGVADFLGELSASMDNAEVILTLPIGATSRMGIGATMMIEAAVAGGSEVPAVAFRNQFMRDLGLPEESATTAVLATAMLGGLLGGLARSGRAIADARAAEKALAENLTDDIATEAPAVGRAIINDLEDEAVAAPDGDPAAVNEAQARQSAARVAADNFSEVPVPDRPTAATRPLKTILGGEIEEVAPGDLLVQPDRFQFKSATVASGGVTEKLLKIKKWMPERAGITLVYEYADGGRAIADGHQRVALANRLMAADPGQDIKLAARVFKEVDGFSIDDMRVIAAMKNIAESADGLTGAMARDAAKVLRIAPEAISELPSGPGIVRAKELSRLSDEAFDLFINEVIPERFAAMIGRKVEDIEMHGPIARLLEKTNPETTAQAESIVAQALETPVARETTKDLFGDSEVVESLFIERAKVLERAMRILREDRNLFRTLDNEADRVETGRENILDRTGNRETRQEVEQSLAVIQKTAHRAGPISEALNAQAKAYKEKGRLKDAAEAVATAVRTEVQRNGIAGLEARTPRQGAKSVDAGEQPPDPNLDFDDPAGAGVADQIEATRIAENDDLREGFSPDEKARADLGDVIAAGADRATIDSHPAVTKAIADMEALPETSTFPRYATQAWHDNRVYDFDGVEVVGTDQALARWIDRAEQLASGETGAEFTGVRADKEVTIVLGPPASGKSTIANNIALARGAAIVDADDIKKTIPEFRGGIGSNAVHEEGAELTFWLEAAMIEDGTNIVYPKVGSNPSSIRATSQRFRNAGYKVRIVSMDVSPRAAYRRMMLRFVNTGRLIPPKVLDDVGVKPHETFLTLRNEGKEAGYAEIDNNGPKTETKPISGQKGENPLTGSGYDLPGRGQGSPANRGDALNDQASEGTAAGDQFLIEGVEPITPLDRLEALQSAPLRGGADAPGGLFDDVARAQADMFDEVPVAEFRNADGDLEVRTISRQELADELDADDEFIEQVELCL